MAHLIANIKQKFFDSNGDPLVGGKLYTYEAGTSTPLVTYQNKTESTQNTNPIILDANGEASIWVGANAYKFILKDSLDNIQWTVDNVTFLNDSAVTTAKIADGALSADVTGRAKMADTFINVAKLADDAVETAKIKDLNITVAKLANNAVETAKIKDANVTVAKLADDAVETAKIKDANVTTAKLANGSVTPAKLSTSINKTVSSSCGTFTENTGSYQAVTNLSCAITTNGRPVYVCLEPDGNTATAAQLDPFTGANPLLRFKRDTTVIAVFVVPVDVSHAPSLYSFLDEPAAGSYTYTCEIATVSGGSFTIYNTKLVVREL